MIGVVAENGSQVYHEHDGTTPVHALSTQRAERVNRECVPPPRSEYLGCIALHPNTETVRVTRIISVNQVMAL